MSIKKPSVYHVQGLPLAMFGHCFVLINVWRESEALWCAEYNVLIQRPIENLHSEVVDFDITDYPSELSPVTAESMEAEALLQAETYLSLELERRAAKEGMAQLAYLPIRLISSHLEPILLTRVYPFVDSIKKLAKRSRSNDLKNYLRVVLSFTIRPT